MKYNYDTGAVFFDLAEAFESISPKIFFNKAETLNFLQTMLFLLKYFLTYGTQCVKLGTDLSVKKPDNHVLHKKNRARTSFFCYLTTMFRKSRKVKITLLILRMALILFANSKTKLKKFH